jgi:hypothetical protein
MTRSVLVAAAAAGAVLAACGGPAIPNPQTYATIFGRVYDASTNAGLGGVVVTADVVNGTTTAADGSYTLVNVPVGQTDVNVQVPQGYTLVDAATLEGFSVTAGERFQLDIPLNPAK